MKVDSDNLLGSIKSPLAVDPVVSMFLQAAEASCLGSIAALGGLEWVLSGESLVFGVS